MRRDVIDKFLTRDALIGGMKQKGIITYGISSNRQNPFAGAFHDAIFNTWRRFSAQVLYIAPPFIGAYMIMDWATHRYSLENTALWLAICADTL